MRSKQRNPFKVNVLAPSTGLNTRLPANVADKSSLRDSTVASNVRFEDGVARNSPGYQAITMTPTPDSPINLIGQANLNNQLVSVATNSPLIGTTKSLYAQTLLNLSSIGSGYIQVFAGADQIISSATTATLSATYLDTYNNGLNTPVFLWFQISGPTATIDNPSNSTIHLSNLGLGDSVFEIIATDPTSGDQSSAKVKISIVTGSSAYSSQAIFNPNANSMACDPSTGYIYVATSTQLGSMEVQVYNPFLNTIIATIPIVVTNFSNYLVSIQYNPQDGYIYTLANFSTPVSGGNGYGFFKINTSTNTVTSSFIKSDQIYVLDSWCFTPNNKIAATAFTGSLVNNYIQIDCATLTITGTYAVGITDYVGLYSVYSTKDNLVYSIFTKNDVPLDSFFVSFNPSSHAVVTYALPNPLTRAGGKSAIYSPLDDKIYFTDGEEITGGGSLSTIDPTTKAIVALDTNNSNTYGLLLWEPTNGRIYTTRSNGFSNGILRNLIPGGSFGTDINLSHVGAYYTNPQASMCYSVLTNSLYIPSQTTTIDIINAS